MRTITLKVPDTLASRFESASERERLVWAYRLATIVEGWASRNDFDPAVREIREWQDANGVSGDDYEAFFKELASED